MGGLIFLIPANTLLLFIFLYQKTLSPFIGQSCRFSPSCSNYAIEAIKTHGTIIGFLLSAWRILRCNPFCKSGYDPVPTLIKNQNKNIN